MRFLQGTLEWLKLEPGEKVIWLEAWLELLRAALLIRISKRRLPDEHVQSPGASWTPQRKPYLVQRLMISAASHHLKEMSCLERSVALTRMLKRRGVAAEVRIGIRSEPAFEAHAWVVAPDLALDETSREFSLLEPMTDLQGARWK